VLSAEGKSIEVMQARAADEAVLPFIVNGKPYWSYFGKAAENNTIITWLLAGTIPDWSGTPLVLVVTLEENNISLAEHIRSTILNSALNQ
jgi:hypothetical protein